MYKDRYLPIGFQSFEEIRKGGYVYVDKTQYVAELVRGAYYVTTLCRPRRFGKTLFLRTVEAYFEGKKELFKGLYLEKAEEEIAERQNRKPWTPRPVLFINSIGALYKSVDDLTSGIDFHLSGYERKYNCVPSDKRDVVSRLDNLIRQMYKQTGEQVVLLVDDYDIALLETFKNEKLNNEINRLLCAFYSVTKRSENDLYLCVLAGLLQIHERNPFSGFNNAYDISLGNDRFAAICGYTEKEVIDNFMPELETLSAKQNMTVKETVADLNRRYGGFYFEEGVEIFNPNSTMSALQTQEHHTHWVDWFTLHDAVPQLLKRKYFFPDLESLEFMTDDVLMNSDPSRSGGIDRLFQSGFLTIIAWEHLPCCSYTLGLVNAEQTYIYLRELFEYFFEEFTQPELLIDDFLAPLLEASSEGISLEEPMKELKSYLRRIEYKKMTKQYAYSQLQIYQIALYLIFKVVGTFSKTEVIFVKNERVDAIIKAKDHNYIFAFQLQADAQPAEGIQAVKELEYTQELLKTKTPLHLLGFSYDKKGKGEVEWQEEILNANE